MKIWYDTEFLERGSDHPVELISIGMVRKELIPQTGKEHDALADALWCRDAHLELIRATD